MGFMHSDFLRATRILMFALLLSIPTRGSAQRMGSEPQAAMERARQHFKLAEQHKQRGDSYADQGKTSEAHNAYGKAAEQYMSAFRAYPSAAFLFNLAQMHRLRGEDSLAIEEYEKYLELDPNGTGATEARQYMEELRRAQDSTRETMTPDEPAPSPDETLTDSPGPARDETPTIKQPVEPPRSRHRPSPWGNRLRLVGIGTAAAGLVIVGIGAKSGLDAREASQKLSNPGEAWEFEHIELYEAGRRAERNMFMMFGIGGAVIVAGGAIYYAGHRTNTREDTLSSAVSVTLNPGVGQPGVSLSLTGHF